MLLGGWSKGCSLEDYTQVNNPLFFSLLNQGKNIFHKRFGNQEVFSEAPGILLSDLQLLNTAVSEMLNSINANRSGALHAVWIFGSVARVANAKFPRKSKLSEGEFSYLNNHGCVYSIRKRLIPH
jgi:hypothetical protein